MTGKVSKADGRRHTKHAAWYDAHFDKLKRRRDAKVRKSSHGKFAKVADLVAYQEKVTADGTSKRSHRMRRQKRRTEDTVSA
jgi:hypothetical protein